MAMTIAIGATRYLDRPGGRLAYDVQGDGPLVVGTPGMGDVRSVFRFQIRTLLDSGYRVATVDLRSHGESETTFAEHDDIAVAGDLIALVRHLDSGPAVLMGNSMGGAASVLAAAEAPELVTGLVLVGAFVREPVMPWFAKAATAVLLRRPWGIAATGAYYRSLNAGTRPPDLGEHIGRVKTSLRRPGAWPNFVQTTRTSHAPVTARLSDVSVPALVMMGEKDPDFPDPAAEARFTAASLGGPAEVLLVPESGHYPQAQRPDIVNPALVEFLAGLRS